MGLSHSIPHPLWEEASPRCVLVCPHHLTTRNGGATRVKQLSRSCSSTQRGCLHCRGNGQCTTASAIWQCLFLWDRISQLVCRSRQSGILKRPWAHLSQVRTLSPPCSRRSLSSTCLSRTMRVIQGRCSAICCLQRRSCQHQQRP